MSKRRIKNIAYSDSEEFSDYSSEDDYDVALMPKISSKPAQAKSQPKSKASPSALPKSKPNAPKALLESLPEEGERGRQLVLVICGHVDSGKSSTTARLLKITGTSEIRSVGSPTSEELAHMCDESMEERDRGVTINAAVKQVFLKDIRLTIVDAPGHAAFVPAMIKGASLADAALLVVDATDPETGLGTTGQAREHIRLVSSYGIRRFGVVLNKVDRLRTLFTLNDNVDEAALEARLLSIEESIRAILTEETENLEHLEFVRISAVKNENIAIRTHSDRPCLVDVLDNLIPPSFVPSQTSIVTSIRVPVLEKIGKLMSGRVQGTSGVLTKTTKLRVLPQFGERPVFLKVTDRDFQGVTARPGDFLSNLEVDEAGSKQQLLPYDTLFASGSVVLVPADVATVCVTAWKFTAQIFVYKKSSVNVGDEMILPGRQFVLHCGPSAQPVIVTRIMEASFTKKRLAGGDSGIVEFETLNIPLVVVPNESKIVLRYRGCTIARGVVTSINK